MGPLTFPLTFTDTGALYHTLEALSSTPPLTQGNFSAYLPGLGAVRYEIACYRSRYRKQSSRRGRSPLAQVSKGEFELILAGNLDRIGTGRVFVSLDDTEMRTFESVLQESQVEPESIHWGYPAMRIRDPDGNEMIFPQESDA